MLTAQKYYVSDHHENGVLLHRAGCDLLPGAIDSRTFIGTCYTVHQALTVAAVHYRGVKPCPICSKKPDAPPAEIIEEWVELAVKKRPSLSRPKKPVATSSPPEKNGPAKQKKVSPSRRIVVDIIKQADERMKKTGLVRTEKVRSSRSIEPVKHFIQQWKN